MVSTKHLYLTICLCWMTISCLLRHYSDGGMMMVELVDAFVIHQQQQRQPHRRRRPRSIVLPLSSSSKDQNEQLPINVQINEFFKKPVPGPILERLSVAQQQQQQQQDSPEKDDDNILSLLMAPPSNPGVPRPLWLVILGSVPTGLVWYGYYKFCVEEELMQYDIQRGRDPRGYGGFGTLGPFVYGCLLGPLAFILHLPGGMNWAYLGIIFIYYTQFLLYDRVNELYREMDEEEEEPLQLWWTLPIFFPFDLIVGLRQVHYLSQYWHKKRGVVPPPTDPVVEFFPFIGSSRFTWQEFFLTPSLWCSLFATVNKIDRDKLPEPVQNILAIGEKEECQQQQPTS